MLFFSNTNYVVLGNYVLKFSCIKFYLILRATNKVLYFKYKNKNIIVQEFFNKKTMFHSVNQ